MEDFNVERENLSSANISKQVVAWKKLLTKCTIHLEESEAFELLESNNQKFKMIFESAQNNFEVLKLTTMTPTVPLEVRKKAAQILLTNFSNVKFLPLLILMAKNWDNFKKLIPNELQTFVALAIQNTIKNETLGMKGKELFKASEPLDIDNTIVIYIQPRYFTTGNSIAEIPHRNSQTFFSTVLRVLLNSGKAIIPQVLPDTNLLPKNDYPNLPKIGHHTLGKNHKTLHQKIAYLAEYSYLDLTGYGPFSNVLPKDQLMARILKIEQKEANRFREFLFERYCLKRTSKFEQKRQRLVVEDPENTYFFAMQTINDTVMKRAKICQFKSIKIILEQFSNTDKKLIIKPHPLDNSNTTEKFLDEIQMRSNLIISDANIHDLISQCKVTICVNSGVGIEALLHLKTVISVGASDYEIATCHAENESDLKVFINSPDSGPNRNFIAKFLYYFFNEHVCEITDEMAVRKKLASIGLSL